LIAGHSSLVFVGYIISLHHYRKMQDWRMQ